MRLKTFFSSGLKDFFWPAVSGIIMTASFRGGPMAYAAWFALVPLLLSISPEKSLGDAAKKGLAAGFVHSFTLFAWVVYTMHVYGFLPYVLCVPVLVLLALYISLYTSLAVSAASFFIDRPFLSSLVLSFSWVCADYLRGALLTGFPWAFLGYSQHGNLPFIQVADIAGVYGVTFAVVFFNGFVFWLLKRISLGKAGFRGMIGVSGVCCLALFMSFFCAYFFYGNKRLSETIKLESEARKPVVAMIQGNIDQSVKWDPAFQVFTMEKYLAMTKRASEAKPDFIVWPETAVPFYFRFDESLSRSFIDSVASIGENLVFGSPYVVFKGKEPEYYNSVYSMDGDGTILGRYDKTHLVPFGEYTPLKKWIPFIGKMVPLEGDFSTGDKGRLLDTAGLKLGTQICYEIIFPELSRLMVKNGADLIVNVTNDAWFGKTGAPFQHFGISVFRAVENRRSVIRCANTGYSGFIDPSGKARMLTNLYQDAIRIGQVPVLAETSFYTEHGDVFVAVCAAALLLCLLSGIFIFRSNKERK